ncbi:MAG: PaaI family thioesterase [Deltaproteobacteria bacterium]|nr:PaaI family thioesterase [Deltaproteobacteria bacterium]
MERINPDYVAAVRRIVNGCPYFKLLSIDIKDLGWGESRLEILVQEKHLQPFGIVHGGVFASLIDAAAFWAAYCQIPGEVGMTTVEMKINYLAPISTGRMVAKGRGIRAGKTLCLADASVYNESGTLLAHGTATMMILKNLQIQGASGWPPKFLPSSSDEAQ